MRKLRDQENVREIRRKIFEIRSRKKYMKPGENHVAKNRKRRKQLEISLIRNMFVCCLIIHSV